MRNEGVEALQEGLSLIKRNRWYSERIVKCCMHPWALVRHLAHHSVSDPLISLSSLSSLRHMDGSNVRL